MLPLADQILNTLAQAYKPDAIICDLDGCMASFDDKNKVQDWCLQIIKKFMIDHKILFITGRHEEDREETFNWLKDVCKIPVENFELHMNDNPDKVKDFQFKKNCYNKIIKDKYNVLFVIDDRPRVVDAWRKLGLWCLQPNFIDH